MKVGLIYTSTTPELIELVEKEVKTSFSLIYVGLLSSFFGLSLVMPITTIAINY